MIPSVCRTQLFSMLELSVVERVPHALHTAQRQPVKGQS